MTEEMSLPGSAGERKARRTEGLGAGRDELVSIIVPVFNAASSLERCLDSLARQTHENIEVLLVDDGSTDRSGEICDRRALSDARFRAIHEHNSGVSAARNIGLRKCTGSWVTFVDADDYVEANLVESLLRSCEDHGSEIAWCPCFDEDADGNVNMPRVPATHASGSIQHYDWASQAAHFNVWGALFSCSVLEGLEFPTDLSVGEDTAFFSNAIGRARSLSFVARPLYHYVHYDNSASHGVFSEAKVDEIRAWQRICDTSTFPGASGALAFRCFLLAVRYWNDSEFQTLYRRSVVRSFRKNFHGYLDLLHGGGRWHSMLGGCLFFLSPALYMALKGGSSGER